MIELRYKTEDANLVSLCRAYWEVDAEYVFVHSVSDLATLYNAGKSKIPKVVQEACVAYVSDWKCSSCGSPFALRSRSDLAPLRSRLLDGSYKLEKGVCSVCAQKQRAAEIEQARLQREQAQRDIRQRIRDTFPLSARKPIDFDSLTLTDAVYLISILRGAQENFEKIRPLQEFDQPLAPGELASEIVGHLQKRKLLYIHPETEAFSFAEDDFSRYYTHRTSFATPPIEPSKSLIAELHKFIGKEWSEEWCSEGVVLWKRVALAECLEYFLFCLEEHNFEFNPGDKTIQYFEFALEHFSTARVFRLVWQSVTGAAAFYQRGSVPKRQAANMASSAIQRNAEKALAEKWEVKPFRRNYKCPQTIVSDVLYNLVLGFGEDGFNNVPDAVDIFVRKSADGNSA